MALPSTMPDPDRGSPFGAFNCGNCLGKVAASVRAKMHCGYMEHDEWIGARPEGVPPAFNGEPYEVDVCPGWLVRQPGVVEAAEAYAAMEAGILDRYDPEGLHVVTQGAMLCQRSFNMHQAAKQRQLSRKLGGNP